MAMDGGEKDANVTSDTVTATRTTVPRGSRRRVHRVQVQVGVVQDVLGLLREIVTERRIRKSQ